MLPLVLLINLIATWFMVGLIWLVQLVHYRQCIRMEGGVAETFIPLAQNEAPGAYVLRICDLLSQQRTAYAIDIES